MESEIKACKECGSAVTTHRALDGATYVIPVKDSSEFFFKGVDEDRFILDRLQRAEKIIVDLRQQLRNRD